MQTTLPPEFNPETHAKSPQSHVDGADYTSSANSTGSRDSTDSRDSYDELIRIFNTALVTNRASVSRAYADEMMDLVRAPAFRAILVSIRQLAISQKITERQAAEQVIGSFRKMDSLWSDYLIQEGLQRLKT